MRSCLALVALVALVGVVLAIVGLVMTSASSDAPAEVLGQLNAATGGAIPAEFDSVWGAIYDEMAAAGIVLGLALLGWGVPGWSQATAADPTDDSCRSSGARTCTWWDWAVTALLVTKKPRPRASTSASTSSSVSSVGRSRDASITRGTRVPSLNTSAEARRVRP